MLVHVWQNYLIHERPQYRSHYYAIAREVIGKNNLLYCSLVHFLSPASRYQLNWSWGTWSLRCHIRRRNWKVEFFEPILVIHSEAVVDDLWLEDGLLTLGNSFKRRSQGKSLRRRWESWSKYPLCFSFGQRLTQVQLTIIIFSNIYIFSFIKLKSYYETSFISFILFF